MFPWLSPQTRTVEPRMEAGGIEPPQDAPGLIYAIQSKLGGPVKIGWTSSRESLPERLKSLQIGNPYPLLVVWTTEGSRNDEGALHRSFSKDRLAGEWFNASPELVALTGAIAEPMSLAGVYDEAWDAGYERGHDDAFWLVQEEEGGEPRPLKSLRAAECHDDAERASVLTGSAWARRRMWAA